MVRSGLGIRDGIRFCSGEWRGDLIIHGVDLNNVEDTEEV